MLHNLHRKKVNLPAHAFSTKVTMLTPVDVAGADGIVRKASEFKSFDVAESNKPFGSGDFEVASLLAVGALSKLTSTYMSPTSSMKIADSFENLNFGENAE